MKLKEGDKVRFHDATNEMLVLSIEDNYVNCLWTNRLGAEMRGSFPDHLLIKVEE
ncbi:hypothetical protein [Aquimarina litoralis]|uniref:hypothetical protein n=1 Tax=Aquimarina litoralis TaxID=584605 RepID=UPI001C55C0FB|nr:hypothetical protein [Aquimarina litoralis]